MIFMYEIKYGLCLTQYEDSLMVRYLDDENIDSISRRNNEHIVVYNKLCRLSFLR